MVDLVEVLQALQQLIHLFQIKIDVENCVVHIDVPQEFWNAESSESVDDLLDVLVLVGLEKRRTVLDVLFVLEVLAKLLDALVHVKDGVKAIVNLTEVVICLHSSKNFLNLCDRYFLLLVFRIDNALFICEFAVGLLKPVEQFADLEEGLLSVP